MELDGGHGTVSRGHQVVLARKVERRGVHVVAIGLAGGVRADTVQLLALVQEDAVGNGDGGLDGPDGSGTRGLLAEEEHEQGGDDHGHTLELVLSNVSHLLSSVTRKCFLTR